MRVQKIKTALYNVALAATLILLFVLLAAVLALKATPMP
jgi:hypothetical protein